MAENISSNIESERSGLKYLRNNHIKIFGNLEPTDEKDDRQIAVEFIDSIISKVSS